MGSQWFNGVEDFRPAQPAVESVWDADHHSLVWRVAVHTEHYPTRSRVAMGTVVVRGSLLGDLMVAIQE